MVEEWLIDFFGYKLPSWEIRARTCPTIIIDYAYIYIYLVKSNKIRIKLCQSLLD